MFSYQQLAQFIVPSKYERDRFQFGVWTLNPESHQKIAYITNAALRNKAITKNQLWTITDQEVLMHQLYAHLGMLIKQFPIEKITTNPIIINKLQQFTTTITEFQNQYLEHIGDIRTPLGMVEQLDPFSTILVALMKSNLLNVQNYPAFRYNSQNLVKPFNEVKIYILDQTGIAQAKEYLKLKWLEITQEDEIYQNKFIEIDSLDLSYVDFLKQQNECFYVTEEIIKGEAFGFLKQIATMWYQFVECKQDFSKMQSQQCESLGIVLVNASDLNHYLEGHLQMLNGLYNLEISVNRTTKKTVDTKNMKQKLDQGDQSHLVKFTAQYFETPYQLSHKAYIRQAFTQSNGGVKFEQGQARYITTTNTDALIQRTILTDSRLVQDLIISQVKGNKKPNQQGKKKKKPQKKEEIRSKSSESKEVKPPDKPPEEKKIPTDVKKSQPQQVKKAKSVQPGKQKDK